MAAAFQSNAFQNNAFQIGAAVPCVPAFQLDAFQNSAFQVCAVCTPAFQDSAFQNDAFQVCLECITAFNAGAYQNNAFQVCDALPPTPPPVVPPVVIPPPEPGGAGQVVGPYGPAFGARRRRLDSLYRQAPPPQTVVPLGEEGEAPGSELLPPTPALLSVFGATQPIVLDMGTGPVMLGLRNQMAAELRAALQQEDEEAAIIAILLAASD